MQAVFTPIDRSRWVREPWYQYFTGTVRCRIGFTVPVDITELVAWQKGRKLHFFPCMLWAVMRAVNRIPELRLGRDAAGTLGTWSHLSPSYTILHPEDKTFSDTWTEWNEDFPAFYEAVQSDIAAALQVRGRVKAKDGEPAGICSVSMTPFLAFTSFTEETRGDLDSFVPLVRIARYSRQGDRVLAPVAVVVHHAAADSWHVGRLYELIAECGRELASRA